jgi:MATE family multidrug resistance protein
MGFMCGALIVWILVRKLYEGAWDGWTRKALEVKGIFRVLRFGLPVGVQISLEIWAFTLANLWAGWLGTGELAAHTVVINMATLSFMVPLGLSFGTVTRVGNLIGAGKPQDAQRASWVALVMGGGVMMLFAALFIGGRNWLPTLYTGDQAVVSICAVLLPIAAAFQLFDGIQVVGAGVLRGMGRTRPAAVFNAVGYYLMGLPLGYWMAFHGGFGLPGIWWGMTLGLAVVSVLFVVWIWYRGPARVDARVLD